MRQENLEGLVAFVQVAESRSFSAAAARMGLTPSAVSQSIRLLEARVGIALFTRTTRSVRLTEAGERYLERVRPAVLELDEAAGALAQTDARPTGTLRLNLPRVAHMVVLQPVLRKFLDAYPELSIELSIDSTLTDLIEGGFDAGIRYNNIVDGDMVGVPVGPSMSSYVVATAEHWARYGTPSTPHDLLGHRRVGFRYKSSGVLERWAFVKNGKPLNLSPTTHAVVVNDVAAIVQAALDGIGAAYITSAYVEGLIESGRLVRVLHEWTPSLPNLTLYYPSRRGMTPKLRALVDFLKIQPNEASLDD
ncbi:LysR family transcriptional regulator [Variovorax sp. J2P1-59]|uniref:LysR family transcriptional regulator n=1 Tax=Variovorax flavidus TaxID=3053501 RepID=UPI002578AB02|nr:LysR family transcriptional regulator [Variovorax sp. J2P1-59]MDM0078574.1 LysR family transcriptional regulator [Variovorax sp. J2P1-59]